MNQETILIVEDNLILRDGLQDFLTAEGFQVLVAANDHLINMGVTDMFATVIYGIYSRESGKFTFARAGHPMPIILDREAGVLPMSRSIGQPIGIFSPVALDVQTVTIPQGGVMLLFSDGLIEVMNKQGEALEVEGAEQALRRCHRATAQEICQHMLQVAMNHAGEGAQQDDIALVCLKRR